MEYDLIGSCGLEEQRNWNCCTRLSRYDGLYVIPLSHVTGKKIEVTIGINYSDYAHICGY